MADLPTNYYDDILSESMNGKKKFRLTYRNGTTEEVTIEDISEYDQYGSKFGAGDINKINQAVNEKFDSGDVVDPMLTTEPGFAADAYQTKLQFDEQNKNLGAIQYWIDNGFLPDPNNPKQLLYNYGDECSLVTGGWSAGGTSTDKNTNSLKVATSTGTQKSSFVTSKAINLTGRSKLKLILTRSSSGNYASSTSFNVYIGSEEIFETRNNFSDKTEFEVDITNYNGEQQIKLQAEAGGSSGASGFVSTVNIYEVAVY